jgi:hypothetical protein
MNGTIETKKPTTAETVRASTKHLKHFEVNYDTKKKKRKSCFRQS